MIIILEGLNGTGKSATALPLADTLGASILRPFRGKDTSKHLGRDGDGRMERLRKLGIPANTFVDDIYVADFLASTGVPAVLDRSMGSAVAYGMLYGDIPSAVVGRDLLTEWQNILMSSAKKILYVNVTCRRDVRRKRCKDDRRWCPTASQENMLEQWFSHIFGDIQLPKMILDTSDIEPSEIGATGCRRVTRALGGW